MFLEGVENERETCFSKIPSQEPKMMCVPHRQRRDCHASPACWVCVGEGGCGVTRGASGEVLSTSRMQTFSLSLRSYLYLV